MKVHPVAELFPMMNEEELVELAYDIKDNGLLNPIILDKDGVLIDGRNRLKACELMAIKPRFETLNGTDAVAFILAQNVARRHLTKGQQAMAVAKACSLNEQTKTVCQRAKESHLSIGRIWSPTSARWPFGGSAWRAIRLSAQARVQRI
jgi:hypothetical protein